MLLMSNSPQHNNMLLAIDQKVGEDVCDNTDDCVFTQGNVEYIVFEKSIVARSSCARESLPYSIISDDTVNNIARKLENSGRPFWREVRHFGEEDGRLYYNGDLIYLHIFRSKDKTCYKESLIYI